MCKESLKQKHRLKSHRVLKSSMEETALEDHKNGGFVFVLSCLVRWEISFPWQRPELGFQNGAELSPGLLRYQSTMYNIKFQHRGST